MKLKIAIQKSGRLYDDSVKLLKDCGIDLKNGVNKLKTESEQIHSLAELGVLDGEFHSVFEPPLHGIVEGGRSFAIGIERRLSNER